jgi:hypothetical protein
MHTPPTIIESCDSLEEFTEDAAAFAQGTPEFLGQEGTTPLPESAEKTDKPLTLPPPQAPDAAANNQTEG